MGLGISYTLTINLYSIAAVGKVDLVWAEIRTYNLHQRRWMRYVLCYSRGLEIGLLYL